MTTAFFDFEKLEVTEQAEQVVATYRNLLCSGYMSAHPFCESPAATAVLPNGMFDFDELEAAFATAAVDDLETACFAAQDNTLEIADLFDPLCSRVISIRKSGRGASRCKGRVRLGPGNQSSGTRTGTKNHPGTLRRRPCPQNRWISLAVVLLRREDKGLGPHRCFIKMQRCRERTEDALSKLVFDKRRRARDEPRWTHAFFEDEMRLGSKMRRIACRGARHTQIQLPGCSTLGGPLGISTRALIPNAPKAGKAQSHWIRFIKVLLRHEGWLPLQKSPARACTPSTQLARRWFHLHGPCSAPQPAILVQFRPYQLTMGYQLWCAAMLELRRHEKRQAQQWSTKWMPWPNRRRVRQCFCFWSAPILACKEEAAKLAAAETARWQGAPATLSWSNAPVESARDPDQDIVAAALLDLDLETYWLLLQLEEREIGPEDYELLGRLNESAKPATLCPDDLRRFPTEIYLPEASSDACEVSPQTFTSSTDNFFGVDYWRLPLPRTDGWEETEEYSFGPDFWRLPMPSHHCDSSTCDGGQDSYSVQTPGCEDICAVCYSELVAGDQVRILQPCGHCFHKDCIDRWLLEASTTCPVDKQELRC